jgi:hypothetical protein
MDVIPTTTEGPQARSFLKVICKGKKKISYATSIAGTFSLEKETVNLFESGDHVVSPKDTMKIISWNCRGSSPLAAFYSLRVLIRYNNPDVLSLSETKASPLSLLP